MNKLTLNTDKEIYFGGDEHYYLSNFSSFRIRYGERIFNTSEAAYQAEKFSDQGVGLSIITQIQFANSAYEAKKIARKYEEKYGRKEWDTFYKVDVMRCIIRAKYDQHEYIQKKLSQTGDKILIENNHQDRFWGCGEDGKGLNWLGKIWMDLRKTTSLLPVLPEENNDAMIKSVVDCFQALFYGNRDFCYLTKYSNGYAMHFGKEMVGDIILTKEDVKLINLIFGYGGLSLFD
jgi:ribA/ribD-fused uncharacterized protein